MNKRVIYLAGGCFWGVERYFQILGEGVLATETGYANGNTPHPTYEEVCSGTTGHAETVKLTYDADVLTLREIMAHFFRMIDPTTKNRQGNDIGTQYRSGVYVDIAKGLTGKFSWIWSMTSFQIRIGQRVSVSLISVRLP
jgi:methionine-S-sulfoxide reductase